MSENRTGGCLCGAIRYRLTEPPAHTTLCHCADCRKASGAPVVAWTFFRSGTLQWTRGTPRELHHAGRVRTFCGDCGTPLHFHDPGIPQWFEITTATLDDAAAHRPADECWMADRLPWCVLAETLPAYQENAPLPS